MERFQEKSSNPKSFELYELESYRSMLANEFKQGLKTENSKLLLECLCKSETVLSLPNECLVLEEIFKELTEPDHKDAALEFKECLDKIRSIKQYQAYLDDPLQTARA